MNTQKTVLGFLSTLQYKPPALSSLSVSLGSPCHFMHILASPYAGNSLVSLSLTNCTPS